MIPFSNVRLTQIEGGGLSENYRDDENDGAAKWSGDAEAHLLERVLADVNAGRLDQVRQSQLTFSAALAPDLAVGDDVTYDHNGQTTSRKITHIEPLEPLGWVRVYLTDQ